jgi:tetratricopeptide (TPR) repeat protein
LETLRDLLAQGINLHSSGQLDQAQSIYESILAKSPNNPDALNLLGVLATQRQDYQKALELIQKALTERPGHPVILLNLGNVLRGLNKLDEAAEFYHTAIKQKPDFADAHYNLGIIYRDQKEFSKAIESLKLSLKLKPELFDANLILTEVYRNQGNVRASEACLDAVSSHSTVPPDVLMRTGAWYMLIGILPKAENCFRRVVAYNPADSPAYKIGRAHV